MNNEMHYPNFKSHLEAELARRCEQNPSYSLRAFAKSLGIEASPLSAMIRGKRTITTKTIEKLGKRLGLTPLQLERYSQTDDLDQDLENRQKNFKDLSLHMYHLISEWYHFAILELMLTKEFRSDPKWVAKALGITVSEVNISLNRMQDLELLEIGKNGEWIDLTGGKTNLGPSDYTDIALKKYQKKILEMASVAVDEVPLDLRDQTGTTFAIETSKIPEAKKLITKFRREMGRLLTGKNADEVYQLSVSLFPLSKIKETK